MFSEGLDYYAFSALINFFTSLILGTFIYLKNRRDPINVTFGLFAWCVAAWSFAYFFWQLSSTEEGALFWSRALMGGAIFTAVAYFHFVLALLGILKQKGRILAWSYALFFVFFLLNFTPLFVSRVEPALSFTFWPKPGPMYHPFLAIWFFYLVYSAYLLITHLRKSIGIKHAQIRYVLIGLIVAFASGSTNYFLWYNIPIPPFGNILVSLYVIIFVYAILKHHLFNIKVIATEFLVAVTTVFLLINVFTSDTTFEYLWKSALLIAFLVSGYLLIKSVLNEIKQREELQQAYSKLKELDEAKSEFISIASHQLRTPLTAIKGYISMLVEGTYGKLASKQKKPMENVYQSSERLITLVNDLLNISRIEAGKIKMEPQKVKLQEVVDRVVDELQIKAKQKKLKLVLQKTKLPLPSFHMDPPKVRNIVLNILDNAIRYTTKGSITVSISLQQKQRPYETKSALIAIKDTGEGMSKGELNHLFESFSRGTTGSRMWTEGAGLGLYIAKQFVQMHKGKIWAKSPGKGKGSTFFVQLPMQ